MTHIGLALSTQRKNLKISQNSLAKKINIAQSTISYIEKGETNPSFDIVEKIIIEGFNMTFAEFFSNTNTSIENYLYKELLDSIKDLPEDKIKLLTSLAKAMTV